jgi:hypothetical protein
MSKVGALATMFAAVVLSISVISSTASAEDIGKATSSGLDDSRLTYTRLYCTPDNESHFAELTAELTEQNFAPPAASIRIGANQPASSVFFAGFEPHWGAADLANHLYRGSAVCSGPWCILDHNVRWRDEAAARRRHCPSRRRCALQRAHDGSGRHSWIPSFRSLTPLSIDDRMGRRCSLRLSVRSVHSGQAGIVPSSARLRIEC